MSSCKSCAPGTYSSTVGEFKLEGLVNFVAMIFLYFCFLFGVNFSLSGPPSILTYVFHGQLQLCEYFLDI